MASSASRALATGRALIAFAREPLARANRAPPVSSSTIRILPLVLVSTGSSTSVTIVSFVGQRLRLRGSRPPVLPARPVPRPRTAAGSVTVNSVPLPGRGLHRDLAAMLLDDALRHGQSQARAVLVLLGGEKRFEDLRQHLGRDARPGVASRGSAPVRPRRRISVATSSMPPCGMASVAFTSSTSIDLLDLVRRRRRPAADPSPGGSAARFPATPAWCCTSSQRAPDQRIQIVGLAMAGRLAREGQQVAHDLAAALALALDDLQLLDHRRG